MTCITALVFLSNNISAKMARAALRQDDHDLSRTVLVKQRPFFLDWEKECAEVVSFNTKPSLKLSGQYKTIGYYYKMVRSVKRTMNLGTVRDIYIPNIDNIVCNHLVQSKRQGALKGEPRISVVAEGFMNYQDIGLDNRESWRWLVKPTLSKLLGLRFRQPETHLSGSFEPEVERIFAYSKVGLMAPAEKVIEVRFPVVAPTVTPDRDSALLVLTGMKQLMSDAAFETFKTGFADWINARNYRRVWVKRHPFYSSGGVEDLVDRAEILDDTRPLEDMAAEIPAATAIGYCTTSLVTLRLVRPDITCIDWGSDFYIENAYHGDDSIIGVLNSAGVELAKFGGRM